MKIVKGTFKIREGHEGSMQWAFHEGSYAYDFPFYIHRKNGRKLWKLSHMATGYNIKSQLSLKNAKALSKELKKWPLFLMPTPESVQMQKELLPTHKQNLLQQIINNAGDTNEQ